MFGKAISDIMIKPGKSPVFETPDRYGLTYEDVEFQTKDKVTLSGWLIKGGTDKIIIQSHFGVQCSRCGFTQQGKGMMKNALWTSDIHFLNHAKYLVQAGYSVLMYDLRNHGNSGSAESPWITWGLEERKDILAAVEFVRSHPDLRGASMGLLSICMGAASTTFAYGMESELADIPNVKALVAVQPLTYDYFVEAMGLPGFLVNAGNVYNLKHRGVSLTGDSFLPYAKSITVPTLVIQNRNDPMTNLDMVNQYYEALQVEKDMLWLQLEKKRGAAYHWLGHNSQAVLDWFGKYLQR